MKIVRAWMVLVLILLVGLLPIAAGAHESATQETIEENWVEGVPTPWFCLMPPVAWVCVPP